MCHSAALDTRYLGYCLLLLGVDKAFSGRVTAQVLTADPTGWLEAALSGNYECIESCSAESLCTAALAVVNSQG